MSSDADNLFEEVEEFESDFSEAVVSLDDAVDSLDDAVDSVEESRDAIGETSQESIEEEVSEVAPTAAATSRSSRSAILKSLTIYDAMLIASALSILIACVLLLWELSAFGGPFYQWRTSEALVEPLSLP